MDELSCFESLSSDDTKYWLNPGTNIRARALIGSRKGSPPRRSRDAESVEGVGGLRALDFSFFDGQSIRRSAIGFPRFEVEMSAGRDLAHADVLEGERFSGLANSGWTRRTNKVSSHAVSDDRCVAIGFDQHSRFFVDGNFARRIGPAILHDAGEKDQSSTHA